MIGRYGKTIYTIFLSLFLDNYPKQSRFEASFGNEDDLNNANSSPSNMRILAGLYLISSPLSH